MTALELENFRVLKKKHNNCAGGVSVCNGTIKMRIKCLKIELS